MPPVYLLGPVEGSGPRSSVRAPQRENPVPRPTLKVTPALLGMASEGPLVKPPTGSSTRPEDLQIQHRWDHARKHATLEVGIPGLSHAFRLVGPHGEFDSVSGFELGHQARNVELDGAHADVEYLADFGVRLSSCDRDEYFFFTFCQGLDGLDWHHGRPGAPTPRWASAPRVDRLRE